MEKLQAIYGDQWAWIAFDPRHKVVVHFVVGRHVQANANGLVKGLRDRSDGSLPLFTSDELKLYDDALLEAYDVRKEFKRSGKRGWPRKPILKCPRICSMLRSSSDGDEAG